VIRRIVAALCAAGLIASLTASAAFAGEVTGNGKLLQVDGGGKWGTGLHARSACAYSGQEDLQFFTNNGDGTRLPEPQKGIPSHSQNWGHIPDRQSLPAELHPGMSCNPTRSTFFEP
jgi:hypothetical protein